jgi:hypothetical protein
MTPRGAPGWHGTVSATTFTSGANTLLNADTGTGLGSIVIGGASAATPVGWWLNVPSNVLTGAYTSTVTMEIVAGP